MTTECLYFNLFHTTRSL